MGVDTRDGERWRRQLEVLSDSMRVFAEAAASPQTLMDTVTRQTAGALHAFCRFALTSPDDQWLVPAAMFDGCGGDIGHLVEQLAVSSRLRLDDAHPLARSIRTGESSLMQFTREQWR